MTMTAVRPGQDAETAETEPKKSKRTLIIVLVVVLLAGLGGAYQFLLRPSGDQEPKPGLVVPLEAVQINLAGGHYLRLGLALQAAEGAEEVEGSKALDAAIELFSGRKVAEVSDPKQRGALKEELSHQVRELYDDEVLEVYFTDFVTQ
ncbi:flagellar basal body-associated FliL family protein [Nocardioides daejeonensis]|uniref:flagellar basal body-associated FliL family protein n=1 Tax=Nocardioides daejeonensis TaxID=1046556 RepID=UPI000D747EAE|nr:flagellar basal body-associated FliL family protein [Nocardioides daejeonensis]